MQGTQLQKSIARITGSPYRSSHYLGICAHPRTRQQYASRQLSMPMPMKPAQRFPKHFTRTRKNTAHCVMKGFPRNPTNTLRFLRSSLMGGQGCRPVTLAQADAASDSPKVQPNNGWGVLYCT
jgi:hypothetical protein